MALYRDAQGRHIHTLVQRPDVVDGSPDEDAAAEMADVIRHASPEAIKRYAQALDSAIEGIHNIRYGAPAPTDDSRTFRTKHGPITLRADEIARLKKNGTDVQKYAEIKAAMAARRIRSRA